LNRLYEKETKKLKERWAAEQAYEDNQADQEAHTPPTEDVAKETHKDEEIDQLAEALEKRLKVPSDTEQE
jgi:hypothetical protein